MFLMFFILYMFSFIFQNIYNILTWPREPQDNAYLWTYFLLSEWTNKVILPTLNNSVCFVLF